MEMHNWISKIGLKGFRCIRVLGCTRASTLSVDSHNFWGSQRWEKFVSDSALALGIRQLWQKKKKKDLPRTVPNPADQALIGNYSSVRHFTGMIYWDFLSLREILCLHSVCCR
jgi:hypothetical protein